MIDLMVVSTFVNDVLWSPEGELLSSQTCGPAYFFQRALAAQDKVSWEMVTGAQMTVDIQIIPGKGEFGKVRDLDIRQPMPAIKASNLLVSTLYREWELSTLQTYGGRLFLDIQGLIRNPPAGFGQKQLWQEASLLRPFLVKATEAEARFLPLDFLADQKQNRWLLVTKGSEGSEIIGQGQKWHFAAPPIAELANTLGAGDTYLSTLVSEFIHHGNWQAAGLAATDAAARLLSAKRKD